MNSLVSSFTALQGIHVCKDRGAPNLQRNVEVWEAQKLCPSCVATWEAYLADLGNQRTKRVEPIVELLAALALRHQILRHGSDGLVAPGPSRPCSTHLQLRQLIAGHGLRALQLHIRAGWHDLLLLRGRRGGASDGDMRFLRHNINVQTHLHVMDLLQPLPTTISQSCQVLCVPRRLIGL